MLDSELLSLQSVSRLNLKIVIKDKPKITGQPDNTKDALEDSIPIHNGRHILIHRKDMLSHMWKEILLL